MPSFDYIVPVVYTPENNNSKIISREFTFKECSFEELYPEACSEWLSEKCPSDRSYCQPYVQGDVIYNQLKYNPNLVTEFGVAIIDTETGVTHTSVSMTTQTGSNDDKDYYFNFNISTDQALFDTVKCFIIKVTKNPKTVPEVEYSEPYCVIRCDQKSIVVEGTYTNTDCNGHFYGTFTGGSASGSASIYKSKFRVRGEVQKIGFDFEETKNVTPKSTYTVKARTLSRFRVYVEKIPPYVAEQLAQSFGGQYMYIDSVQYEKPSKMTKDFDEGLSWIPLLEVSQACDQIDFTCE